MVKREITPSLEECIHTREGSYRACEVRNYCCENMGGGSSRPHEPSPQERRSEDLQKFFTFCTGDIFYCHDLIPSRVSPILLLIGHQHSGKSSFINSIFRILNNEQECLIRRAESGPPCDGQTTVMGKAFPVVMQNIRAGEPMMGSGTRDLCILVDIPAFASMDDCDAKRLSCLVDEGIRVGDDSSSFNVLVPQCVFILASAEEVECEKDSVLNGLSKMKDILRRKGLPFVVIITKSDLCKRPGALDKLSKRVAARCSTDSVICIHNYVDSSSASLLAINNDNDKKILDALKQALVFAIEGYVDMVPHKIGS